MKEKWIVAVSGGPDSMALLDMLVKENKNDYIVAHVNYHMRHTSDYDMKIVQAYAEKHKLVFEHRDFEPARLEGNFQHAARVFRYDFFELLTQKHDAKGVYLAHHLDDDVETYLFQKERKMRSEYVGLSAISNYGQTVLRRPLLKYRKKELIAYCDENNIEYAIDESNVDTKYTRNRIRKMITEMDDEVWVQTLEVMYSEKESWDTYQDGLKKTVGAWNDSIDVSVIHSVENPEDHLRMWLKINGVPIHDLTAEHLLEMVRTLSEGKGYYEFGDWILEGAYKRIWLERVSWVHDVHERLEYGVFGAYSFCEQGQLIEGLNLSDKDFPITVRNAKNNDEIVMRYGTKKLNRHFIDRKIPKGKRKNTLVIENSMKHIVFVVGLGSDVHHYANNHNLFVIKL